MPDLPEKYPVDDGPEDFAKPLAVTVCAVSTGTERFIGPSAAHERRDADVDQLINGNQKLLPPLLRFVVHNDNHANMLMDAMMSTMATSMMAMAPSVSNASSCCRGILGILHSPAWLTT